MPRPAGFYLQQPASLSSRRGFTVLELIVALTLGLVLLSAIWTMFRLFLRHQEIETAQVEKTQLVSSLHHLLSRDLLNLIPEGREGPQTPSVPAPPTSPAPQLETTPPLLLFPGGVADLPLSGLPTPAQGMEGVSHTLPATSLQGDSRRLELVVFAGPDEASADVDNSPGSRRGSADTESAAPRLPSRVIVYEFVGLSDDLSATGNDSLLSSAISDPDEDPAAAAIAAVGLWRRESQGKSSAPPSARDRTRRDDRFDSAAAIAPGPSLPPPLEASQSSVDTPSTSQAVEEFAPEIIDMRLEYYDGRKWSSSWDSQRQKRFPVLVRVQLAIETRPAVRDRKLKERLEAGTNGEPETLQEESPLEDPLLDTDSPPSNQRSALPQSDLADSPWDYEFLLFVTAPPAKPNNAEGSGRFPNAQPAAGSPATSSNGGSSRPRSGGLKQ